VYNTSSIIINGKPYFGNSNLKKATKFIVTCDGEVVEIPVRDGLNIHITAEKVDEVESHNGAITITGNSGRSTTHNGDVQVGGDVSGDAITHNGNIIAGTINGNCKTVNGNINGKRQKL